MQNEKILKLAESIFEEILKVDNKYSRRILKTKIEKRSIDFERHINNIKESFQYEEPKLLIPVVEELEKIKNEISILSNGLDKPFLLFIVGVGNYGKSTLLNALIEKRMAEIDALPKTWKIDIFQEREKHSLVEIKYKKGNIDHFNIKEAKVFLDKEEEKRQISEMKVYKEFEKRKNNLDTIKEKEELKKALEKNLLYESKVIEVNWPVDSNDLLKNFRLVDTPGLVQNLLGEVKQNVNDYYHKADGVLWLLDATKISANQSKEMLNKLNKALKEVGGRTDNIIAVLNRIDLIRKNGGETAVNEVLDNAEKIFGSIFKKIIPISAKEALDGIENDDIDLIEQSGIKRLKRSIKNKFFNKAKEIQVESKKTGFKQISNNLNKYISKYENRLNKDNSKRIQLKDDFNNELKDIKKELNQIKSSFLNDYKRKIKNNIESKAKKLILEDDSSVQKFILKNYILEEKYFSHQVKKLEKNINDKLKRFSKFHKKRSRFQEFEHLGNKEIFNEIKGEIKINFNSDFSDNKFNVGISLTFASTILFGPMGLVLGGIASYLGLADWIFIKWKLPKIKKELKDKLINSVSEIDNKIDKQIKSNIKKIEAEVNDIRRSSFSLLHGSPDNVELISKELSNIKELLNANLNAITIKEIILKDKIYGGKYEL
jgi:predicted GTPase